MTSTRKVSFIRTSIICTSVLLVSGCQIKSTQNEKNNSSWHTAPHTQSGCPFCNIVGDKAPATVIMRDDKARVMAFEKIPVRDNPVSVLIIPTTHIQSLKEIDPQNPDHAKVMANMIGMANKLSKLLTGSGDYRTEFHVGRDAGQSVMHLHMHFISKESWKNPTWRK